MQIKFKVHSAGRGPVPVVAHDGAGNPIQANAEGVVVELVAADGSGTGQMIREYVADIPAALALFEVGAEILATYERAPEPAPEPQPE